MGKKTGFRLESLKERDRLQDFRKWMGDITAELTEIGKEAYTGCIWLGIGTSGGLLYKLG
jgi:hypothetical protein